jgi:hypothetical protein
MTVQARFYVAEINQYANQTQGGYAPPAPMGVVKMRPVSRGGANAQWASATPSGEFTMTVRGEAFPWFQDRLGREVAITIEERDPDETPA